MALQEVILQVTLPAPTTVVVEEVFPAGAVGPTGPTGPQGATGASAYQSYVATTSDDPVLSEAAWIAAMVPPAIDPDAVSAALGLGSAAYTAAADYSAAGHNHAGVYDPAGTATAAVSGHAAAADPHGDRAYADSLVMGLVDDRGSFDASINTFPTAGGSGTAGAILKGDLWTISVVAASGPLVGYQVGCLIRALADTPGQTAGNWSVLAVGFGYSPENAANKSTSVTADQASNTKYPTVKALYDWAVGAFSGLTHKTRHATGGADALTPADIGAATEAQGIKADAALPIADAGLRTAQIVDIEQTADFSTAATIPYDATPPQNTEGTEYIAASITPTNASSTLEITVDLWVGGSGGGMIILGLFKDSDTTCFQAGSAASGGGNLLQPLSLRARVPAGSLAARTYKLRIGSNGITVYVNRVSGVANTFGDAVISRLTIREILP